MPKYADYAQEIMEVMKAAQKAIRARLLQHLLPHRLTVAQHKTLQHLHWHRSEGGPQYRSAERASGIGLQYGVGDRGSLGAR